VRRDSGPAVAVSAVLATQRDRDALVLALAADHVIRKPENFHEACRCAATAAAEGRIITFGIERTYPATNYGYIRPGEKLNGASVRAIEAFVEKPDAEIAATYVAERYLWNSGNFLFHAATMLGEIERFEPSIAEAAKAAVGGSLAISISFGSRATRSSAPPRSRSQPLTAVGSNQRSRKRPIALVEMTASCMFHRAGRNSIGAFVAESAPTPDRLRPTPSLRLAVSISQKTQPHRNIKSSSLITGERGCMLTLTIVTILVGAVLGLRYKVFTLLPAVTFVLVFVIGVGVARGAGIWRIALDMMVATAALQLGYAGGSAFAAARERRKLHSGEHTT
jgi:hypothetical protein